MVEERGIGEAGLDFSWARKVGREVTGSVATRKSPSSEGGAEEVEEEGPDCGSPVSIVCNVWRRLGWIKRFVLVKECLISSLRDGLVFVLVYLKIDKLGLGFRLGLGLAEEEEEEEEVDVPKCCVHVKGGAEELVKEELMCEGIGSPTLKGRD